MLVIDETFNALGKMGVPSHTPFDDMMGGIMKRTVGVIYKATRARYKMLEGV